MCELFGADVRGDAQVVGEAPALQPEPSQVSQVKVVGTVISTSAPA